MSSSTNYRAFPHIQSILDEAIQRGGARYTLPNEKEAFRWRSTAYHFRKLYQKEQNKLAGIDGSVPTMYDTFFITLEGATCVIQLRERQARGNLTTLDGKPITELTKKYEEPPIETNDFVEIAEQIRGKILNDP